MLISAPPLKYETGLHEPGLGGSLHFPPRSFRCPAAAAPASIHSCSYHIRSRLLHKTALLVSDLDPSPRISEVCTVSSETTRPAIFTHNQLRFPAHSL